MEPLAIAVMLIGIALTIAWIIRSFLAHRRQQTQLRLQSELHHKVLDRFSNAEEALAYLGSSAGERLLAQTPAAEPGVDVYRRVLGSLQAGILLLALGLAFLVLKQGFTEDGADQAFLFFGVIALSLGLGFLTASALGYLLSRHWGLIEPGRPTLSGSLSQSGSDPLGSA